MRHKIKFGDKSKFWVKAKITYAMDVSNLQKNGIVGASESFSSEQFNSKCRVYYFDSEENKLKFIMKYC